MAQPVFADPLLPRRRLIKPRPQQPKQRSRHRRQAWLATRRPRLDLVGAKRLHPARRRSGYRYNLLGNNPILLKIEHFSVARIRGGCRTRGDPLSGRRSVLSSGGGG